MITEETALKQNIEFWESVEKTDPKITKKVEFGKRKYTTIDAQGSDQKRYGSIRHVRRYLGNRRWSDFNFTVTLISCFTQGFCGT